MCTSNTQRITMSNAIINENRQLPCQMRQCHQERFNKAGRVAGDVYAFIYPPHDHFFHRISVDLFRQKVADDFTEMPQTVTLI